MIEAFVEKLKSQFSQFLVDREPVQRLTIPYITIHPEGVVPVIQYLKTNTELPFGFLNDLTAIDWYEKRKPRFEVLYLLKSFQSGKHQRIQVRVPVEDGEPVPSITGIFVGANWPEREVYDLFGIEFTGHPRMDRLIMPDNFIGHPLRKDYPLEGPGQDYLIENLLQLHWEEDLNN